MPSEPVIIKKYENRRLYDTANSRYINLDEVAQMVKSGVEVRVVDAVSGEDITRLVLTQIIIENAKTQGSGFPLDMLRQMIVASGRATQDGFLKYTKAMFDLYENTYRVFTPGGGPLDLMQTMMGAQRPPANPPRAGSPAPETQPPAQAQETVDELRERIEKLEWMLRERASPGTRPAKKKGGSTGKRR